MSFQLVLNGLGSGSATKRLLAARMDPAVLRPWLETDPRTGMPTGRSFITMNQRNPDGTFMVNKEGKRVKRNIQTNATATLRLEDWRRIDAAVMFAQKTELRFWEDIHTANPYDFSNGMATVVIQHAVAVGDASATISMDPVRKGERSRPTLDTALIPVPVIHSDNVFSLREIAVSHGWNGQGSMPLDTTNVDLATRKVSEVLENLCVGTSSSYSYGGGTIYGALNHPTRFTFTPLIPTNGAWTGATLLSDLLNAIQTMKDNFYKGPYRIYYSKGWNKYFAKDYTTTYPKSVLTRLKEGIPEIDGWAQLDNMSDYQMVIIQMTPNVIQGVQGMPMTVVQWEEQGGFEQAFKVLCIRLPRIRADGNGKLGISHGTAA